MERATTPALRATAIGAIEPTGGLEDDLVAGAGVNEHLI
jgi:hypothetical protein